MFADCDMELQPSTTPGVFGAGHDYRAGKPITSGDEFGEQVKQCQKIKYVTMESNPAVREQSVKDVLTFLNDAR